MTSLVVHSITAAKLLLREAGQIFGEATQAHPTRQGKPAAREVDDAARLLVKARSAKQFFLDSKGRADSIAIYLPGEQEHLGRLAVERIRDNPADLVRLSPDTVDKAFGWRHP